MAGEGAARASWNKALLCEIVAECWARLYSLLLRSCEKRGGGGSKQHQQPLLQIPDSQETREGEPFLASLGVSLEQCFSLLPSLHSSSASSPWAVLSTAVYKTLRNEKCLWVRGLGEVMRAVGLPVGQAALETDGGGETRSGRWVAPCDALLLPCELREEEGKAGKFLPCCATAARKLV